MNKRVMVVLGTRPEAIKLAPLILALRMIADIDLYVVSTGQHREMLQSALDSFGIEVNVDLDIAQGTKSLASMSAKLMAVLPDIFLYWFPDLLIVQGDTTSAWIAALCGFYHGIEVAHVEAGLRSGDIKSPFPEEANRILVSRVASIHFASTNSARENLLAEGVEDARIVVTGNIVIDSLFRVVEDPAFKRVVPLSDIQNRLILVTVHRRESWDQLKDISRGIAKIAKAEPQTSIVLPLHLNPLVRESIRPVLGGLANVHLVEPIPYAEFVSLMKRAYLIITDSGGIQEEAPSLGIPVLVIRNTTERREAVEYGSSLVVGTECDNIVFQAKRVLHDSKLYASMSEVRHIYGDGRATERIISSIRYCFGLESRPDQFQSDVTRRGFLA